MSLEVHYLWSCCSSESKRMVLVGRTPKMTADARRAAFGLMWEKGWAEEQGHIGAWRTSRENKEHGRRESWKQKTWFEIGSCCLYFESICLRVSEILSCYPVSLSSVRSEMRGDGFASLADGNQAHGNLTGLPYPEAPCYCLGSGHGLSDGQRWRDRQRTPAPSSMQVTSLRFC